MNKNIKYLKLKFDEDRIKSQNISPRYNIINYSIMKRKVKSIIFMKVIINKL